MYKLVNPSVSALYARRGFSLVEALVVLVVSATLMTVFSQVYLSSERANRRLAAYTEENRSNFFARQQLRAWLSAITVSDSFGRESDPTNLPGLIRQRASDEISPLSGTRVAMHGFLRDSILSPNKVRSFTLEIAEADTQLTGVAPTQLYLSFSDPDIQIPLRLDRYAVFGFSYVNDIGERSPIWPPQSDEQEGSLDGTITLQESLNFGRGKRWIDTLPHAIVIEYGDPNDPTALVVDVTP